ncbi:MAG: glycosyltransferase [Candidatus Kariarchaeaceae archaeon]|jgi:hypothetical protein
MIKICHITEAFGGIATYTNFLSDNLQRINYNVETLSINYDQEFCDLIKQESTSKGKNIISIKSYPQIRDILINKIIASNADIIHFQHEFNIFRSNRHFLELLDLINNYTKKIVLITLHSVFTDCERIQFYEKCSKMCDSIIVHQENAKQFLVNYDINPNKIVVIPHGTPDITQHDSSLRFFKSNKIKIIFSGFITETKSFDKALASLISYPGFEIIVAGMVRNEESLAKIRKLKNKSRADLRIIPRFLRAEELVSMIREANYMILPYDQSYYSSSGMLHLGVGLNTITLVSSSPKFKELTERVPECEVRGGNYKQAILNIERQNLRDSILSKLFDFAEGTSWDKTVKMTGKIYDFLLKKGENILSAEISEFNK